MSTVGARGAAIENQQGTEYPMQTRAATVRQRHRQCDSGSVAAEEAVTAAAEWASEKW